MATSLIQTFEEARERKRLWMTNSWPSLQNADVSINKADDVEQILSKALGTPVRSFLDPIKTEPNLALARRQMPVE